MSMILTPTFNNKGLKMACRVAIRHSLVIKDKVILLVMSKSINILLFPIIPIISIVGLIITGGISTILVGIVFIVITTIIFEASFPSIKTSADKSSATLYFFSVLITITVCWIFINSNNIGQFFTFLFAFFCCYYPYQYNAIKGEMVTDGDTNNLSNRTNNAVNNYSVIGYFVFGIIANFTNLPILYAYIPVILIGIFLSNGLLKK